MLRSLVGSEMCIRDRCVYNVSASLESIGTDQTGDWGLASLQGLICANRPAGNTSNDCCNPDGDQDPCLATFCWSGYASGGAENKMKGWTKKITSISYTTDSSYTHDTEFSLKITKKKAKLCVKVTVNGTDTDVCSSDRMCTYDPDEDMQVHKINGLSLSSAETEYGAKLEEGNGFYDGFKSHMDDLLFMAC
eukprot:TRINITY_DN29_c0_g1_i1.p1 TRINITY_DN29_c0_g1~~TRINITY_DN29_c0_g1_i1.p1  ORF type:complete len:207 (-),score=66.43 TRINITY_DN29_c0_g1_i1:297-872(-)